MGDWSSVTVNSNKSFADMSAATALNSHRRWPVHLGKGSVFGKLLSDTVDARDCENG